MTDEEYKNSETIFVPEEKFKSLRICLKCNRKLNFKQTYSGIFYDATGKFEIPFIYCEGCKTKMMMEFKFFWGEEEADE